MSTTPTPTPPSAPPAPGRSSNQAILIALLIIVLIVVVGVLAIFIGLRTILHNIAIHEQKTASGGNEVSINTPVGDIRIHQGAAVDAAMLGLPLYPGAHRVEDDHDSAHVRMNFPGEQSLNVLAAKFETSDPIAKVRTFYQDQWNSQMTRFTEKNSDGSMVFEIKQGNQEKIVVLKKAGDGTRISMVRILHGAEEAN